MLRRVFLLFGLAVGFVAVAAASPAHAARGVPKPVPSLEPAATQKLWHRLVTDGRKFNAAGAECRPARVVFYAATDWLRLTTKLGANASSCANYFVSVPPLAADKTQLRGDQAWRIRALGPRFHALAEISWNGWSAWVTANGRTWYEAGVEARRRMALTGYDVGAGDSWALNELSSAVRRGDGTARASVREFVRGLHDGDGTLPAARGVVFIAGIAQSTTSLGTYKSNLQAWYADAPFWADMNAYVSDWAQEAYGDLRTYAVAGATAEVRRDALNEYLQHEVTLANSGPEGAAAARSFLQEAHSPLANAAWAWDSAFGWTAAPVEQMQDYVSAQVYAARSFDGLSARRGDRFGFAWAPKNLFAASTAEYNARTATLLDRLAVAVRDSGEPFDAANPGAAACGPAGQNLWCRADLAGAAFNPAWRTFADWPVPTPEFTAPSTLIAGEPAGLALRLQNTQQPLTVTLSSSSPGGAFALGESGLWSPTLALTVSAGGGTVGFLYRDTLAGSPVLTAAGPWVGTTTQAQAVVPGALASLTLAPAVVNVVLGGTRELTVRGADGYGNPVAAAPVWSLSAGTPGTIAGAGDAATFTASATTGGAGSVVASVGGVTALAPVLVRGRDAAENGARVGAGG